MVGIVHKLIAVLRAMKNKRFEDKKKSTELLDYIALLLLLLLLLLLGQTRSQGMLNCRSNSHLFISGQDMMKFKIAFVFFFT